MSHSYDTWGSLLGGNERYRAGTSTARRAFVPIAVQRPRAAVLSCSDARVSPEAVFDVAPGELFSVRTAGHTIDPAVVGSLVFACDQLAVDLIVVLGHTDCGAIAAAHGLLATGRGPGGALETLASRIAEPELEVWTAGDLAHDTEPGRDAGVGYDVRRARDAEASIDVLGARHVRRCAANLREADPVLRAAVELGRLVVVASRYDMTTGRVVDLDAA